MLRTQQIALMAVALGAVLASSTGKVAAQCSRGGGGSPGATSIASSPLSFASMSTTGAQSAYSGSALLAMPNQVYQQAQRQMASMLRPQSQRRAQQQQTLLAARMARAAATRAKRAERIVAIKAKYSEETSPGETQQPDAMLADTSHRQSETKTLTSLISKNPFQWSATQVK